MDNILKIQFKPLKVILLFTFSLIILLLAIYGFLNTIYLLILPFIIFIFHILFYVINFYHLLKYKYVLEINESEIIYLPLNLKIEFTKVDYIEIGSYSRSDLLVIKLSDFALVKKLLTSNLLRYLFYINFKSMGKNIIFFRFSILDISEIELKKHLIKYISKEKISI
ncbi:hypothetical protein KK2020170_23530 [Flavobacterium okayamense]|uniref:PH domain-containing protein n=1 Tax=Flavobacterium okayamense TaxID=2830782 RepID=A0ABM7S7M2_9FLAO|nr:hypothetical protein KK2020170_23530 [Flavobacterium okayamense]